MIIIKTTLKNLLIASTTCLNKTLGLPIKGKNTKDSYPTDSNDGLSYPGWHTAMG